MTTKPIPQKKLKGILYNESKDGYIVNISE
jgi:hypothetical protein